MTVIAYGLSARCFSSIEIRCCAVFHLELMWFIFQLASHQRTTGHKERLFDKSRYVVETSNTERFLIKQRLIAYDFLSNLFSSKSINLYSAGDTVPSHAFNVHHQSASPKALDMNVAFYVVFSIFILIWHEICYSLQTPIFHPHKALQRPDPQKFRHKLFQAVIKICIAM